MTTNKMSGFSAAFDDLIERNAAELDALLEADSAGTMLAGFGTRPVSQTHAQSMPAARGAAKQARTITDRNGCEWHFELLDWQREGNEIVVTGKLNQSQTSLSVNATGRAPLKEPPPAGALAGTVDGVPFSAGPDRKRPGASSAGADSVALQQATEQAIENCKQWI